MKADRIRDFVLYIAIGLLVGLVLYGLAVHSDRTGSEIGKWLGFGGNTLIVFGYTIKANRASWKRSSFWAVIFTLLSIHLLAFVSILRRIDEVKQFWWIVIAPIEYIVVGGALIVAGNRPGNAPNRRRRG